MKYRTRVEHVEATQFMRFQPLPDGAYYCDHDNDDEPVRSCCIGALIKTNDGICVLDDGDWVVRWPDGELRAVKKLDFEKRFEPE